MADEDRRARERAALADVANLMAWRRARRAQERADGTEAAFVELDRRARSWLVARERHRALRAAVQSGRYAGDLTQERNLRVTRLATRAFEDQSRTWRAFKRWARACRRVGAIPVPPRFYVASGRGSDEPAACFALRMLAGEEAARQERGERDAAAGRSRRRRRQAPAESPAQGQAPDELPEAIAGTLLETVHGTQAQRAAMLEEHVRQTSALGARGACDYCASAVYRNQSQLALAVMEATGDGAPDLGTVYLACDRECARGVVTTFAHTGVTRFLVLNLENAHVRAAFEHARVRTLDAVLRLHGASGDAVGGSLSAAAFQRRHDALPAEEVMRYIDPALAAREAHARRSCAREGCGATLPAGWRAVYCSRTCAQADA